MKTIINNMVIVPGKWKMDELIIMDHYITNSYKRHVVR